MYCTTYNVINTGWLGILSLSVKSTKMFLYFKVLIGFDEGGKFFSNH
jgi:hypothetical protein